MNPTNPPRVAIVFRGIGGIGGTNNTIADHARLLIRHGYAVDLIGERLTRYRFTPHEGRPVNVPRLYLTRGLKWRWFAWQAQRLIQKRNYDFVAGHGHHGRQDVLSLHNCLHLTYEAIHGHPMRRITGLARLHDEVLSRQSFKLCIANSHLMKAELMRRYGLAESRLRVIHPGYDPVRFNLHDKARLREPTREALGIRVGELVIGLITSADFKTRGLDILLQAYAGLEETRRRMTRLVVVAKQGGLKSYRQQALALGVLDRIHFVPPTRSPQRYFHALDILVHPARSETFGQTVQEAMACGVPVLTSRRVGAVERLPAPARAQVLATPEVEGIRHWLGRLITEPALRRQWMAYGLEAVCGNSAEANFEKTLAVYWEAGLPRCSRVRAQA